MGNWDDEESSGEEAPKQPVVASARRFAGEDEDDDAPEDWDASSDEEQKAAPSASAAPSRKKRTLKAAIAARQEEEARQAAESADENEVVDEGEQKRRDKQHELESDLNNASSLLAGSSIGGKLPAEIEAITKFNPKTKDDFLELSNRLIALITRHQEKPLYATFVEMHTRALAEPLKDVDVRKTASALTTLANEKQKEARDKASGKKKKTSAKPTLGGLKQGLKTDTTAYEEALDDFGNDDFM